MPLPRRTMVTPDGKRSLQYVQDEIDKSSNPKHRAMLENYRDHILYESMLDIDGLMSLIGADPEYRFYGALDHFGENATAYNGREEVRQFYGSLFAVPDNCVGEIDFKRIALADWGIFLEADGLFRVKGADLTKDARANRGAGEVDLNAYYKTTHCLAIACPYDENNKLIGEHVYMGKCMNVENIPEGEPSTPREIFAHWLDNYVPGGKQMVATSA